MPLTFAGKGMFKVNNIKGGHSVRNRLAKMGITEGISISVKNGHYGGPVVVQLNDSQYGLGVGIASKIDVTPAG